jgi:hypothetical protein
MRRRLRKYYPGWLVFGGGGSGGLSSVTTDGSLTGNGTGGSPLGFNPLVNFITTSDQQNNDGATQNRLLLSAFLLTYSLTFSNILINVKTADAVNNSDIGLYNAAGTLIANAGPQTFPTTGVRTFAMLQGAQTILPGRYFFAHTTVSGTLVIGGDSFASSLYYNGAFAVTAAAALPASFVPPALNYPHNVTWFALS